MGKISKRIIRKVREAPSMFGSLVLTLPPIEKILTEKYIGSVQEHREKLPELTDEDIAIVASLESGAYKTTLDELGIEGSDRMLEAGRCLAAIYEKANQSGKFRHLDSFQAAREDVLKFKEIFYWGLNGRILNIVENYIRLPVAFDGINIFFTKADGRQVAARKWHLDGEDRRVLKIAVYFNDVDQEGGPFEMLKINIPPRNILEKSRPPVFTDQELEMRASRKITSDDVWTCTGPAGTVIFCDTARHYHRGRPALSRNRCAVFFNYFAKSPLRPFYCERSTLTREDFRSLSSGLGERQKEALLWVSSQHAISRILPPAPIA